jgi:hypothetical protein
VRTDTAADPFDVVIVGGGRVAARAGIAIEARPLQPLDVCPWDPSEKINARHLGPYLAYGERRAVRA